jgi:hypothetical protein
MTEDASVGLDGLTDDGTVVRVMLLSRVNRLPTKGATFSGTWRFLRVC